MTVFQTIAALLTAAALAGYINQRWFRLPATIALMGFALVFSIGLMGLNRLGLVDLREATAFVSGLDFSAMFLQGMLSLLLFAGAMQLDLGELRSVRLSVLVLATMGVVISTFVTGGLLWFCASLFGIDFPLIYALLFGALISPTDPVAVLAILKKAQVSKRLYAGIGGESLLNDGVGIVVFLALLGVATSGQALDTTKVVTDLLWVVFGGAGLGVTLGLLTAYCLHTVDDYQNEILLTLALASGGYVLAGLVSTSGPIAISIAGLVIGSQGKMRGTNAITRRHLYMFWELLDEIMNAVLFMLMGFVIVLITLKTEYVTMGLMAIPLLLIARFVSVGLPITLIRFFRKIEPGTVSLLTWGGLRGGISIALALALPPVPQKDLLLTMTYIVVVFSILVQGLTFPRLVGYMTRREKEK